MLVQFSIENFKSFKNLNTISFISSSDKSLIEENTFPVNKKTRLNRTSILYGANASGKTNIFKALEFLLNFAVYSGPRNQIGDKIPVKSFVLDVDTINKSSSFELIFYIDKNDHTVRYRYGLTVSQEKVVQEYLYAVNNVKETELFYRDENNISCNALLFKEGNRIPVSSVRNNAAFLSVCAQANGEISGSIVSYFRKINILSNNDDLHKAAVKNDFYVDKHEKILNFLRYADLQIEDFKLEQLLSDSDLVSEARPSYGSLYSKRKEAFLDYLINDTSPDLLFGHGLFKDNKKVGIQYIPEADESAGTNRLFDYAGIILSVLENGGILLVDEFDSSLHPLIVESLISLFNSPVENPKNSQMFISTHSVSFMTNKLFRRDQIWFCEKDRYGASSVYSLADFKEPVRKDATFNKNYLKGKYGAVPSVNEARLQKEMEI